VIAQAEDSLLTLLAPLKKVLRTVEVLPNLPVEELIKTIAPQAPAIYVDFNLVEFEPSAARTVIPRFELLLLARNSRSPVAARQGDARTIGLYEMLDSALARVAGNTSGGFTWSVRQAATSKAAAFSAHGFAAASILCSTRAELDDALMATDLADFKTFNSDYDLPPFAGANEHTNWLHEPPNHATAMPPLSDQLTLE